MIRRDVGAARVLRALVALSIALVALLHEGRAFAHKPSDAYLFLTTTGATVHARWDVALRDLADGTPLDADENGAVTWLEVRARAQEIASTVLAPALELTGDGAPCVAKGDWAPPRLVAHTDGTYLVAERDYLCPVAPVDLGVKYTLFFERDPQHRGVVRVEGRTATHAFVLSKDDRARTVRLDDPAANGRAFVAMVRVGLVHIAEGTDHLAFLFALLFPAVLVRRGRRWEPSSRARPVFVDVLRVVTAFTVAHSVTLAMSALGWVRLPSRLVESAIAASVVLAASNNVRPWLRDARWTMAFSLGLMHGFGFSATLEDLALARGTLLASLFGFNVGVELGQLAVVAVFLPIAFAARKTRFYRSGVLVFGSIVILVIALVWLVERAFAVRIFPA